MCISITKVGEVWGLQITMNHTNYANENSPQIIWASKLYIFFKMVDGGCQHCTINKQQYQSKQTTDQKTHTADFNLAHEIAS
jgi:hypothetical protein